MSEFVYEVVDFEERFEQSLKSGYIDSSVRGDAALEPRLVTNSKESGNLLSVIKAQLKDCDSFDFSVAFVTDGGIQVLVEILNELRDRGVKGRFLTSTYLNFNSPQALRKLLEYPNIEVRVFQGNLHSKSYLFDKGGFATVIVGSSNLTQKALTCNAEWNVLFHSFAKGGMLKATQEGFASLWGNEATVCLTDEWIDRYAEYRRDSGSGEAAQRRDAFKEAADAGHHIGHSLITPNKMQAHALEALNVLHKQNAPRALLVSATGTGKTYLSALDVAEVAPSKVLFIAHRKRILEASRQSFERVLGDAYRYSEYGAGSSGVEGTCVFAMVSTLVNHLEDFDKEEFDYIIIDEAHRTGAASYRKVMEHFVPKFYLGMTATPTRTDGYDVFGLFNHVIAYQITLQDALENEMLAPFHYFGIADLEIDEHVEDDVTLFAKLTCEDRVRHIVGKIEEYSVAKENRRGLIFCSRNDEASELSVAFNELGYRTATLSGENTDDQRNAIIAQLESGDLQYIFSVDILNEGIDIPSLNQVIMLRKTESAIVFVQQLGRGLRKSDGKEYTLVLDFIGNYQTNYLIPIALSGDRSYNKDSLRVVVKEGSSMVPGCSTINFDRVSASRIFDSIDSTKFGTAKLIRDEYERLRMTLGKIPSLLEFDPNGAIDPLLLIRKFRSYHNFLKRYEQSYDVSFAEHEEKILEFVSLKLATGKRASDLIALRSMVESGRFSAELIRKAFARRVGRPLAERTLESARSLLSGGFSTGSVMLVHGVGGEELSDAFVEALENPEFKRQLLEVVDFGLSRYEANYRDRYKETDFVLYGKYTYEEVCRLLNWDKNVSGQNIGGYKFDSKTNTFPVFINYQKDPEISDTIKYEDRFVSENELIAISKQPRSMESPEIKRLQAWPDNEMKSYLFVRKNKDDKDGGKEFYFLGEIHPTGYFAPIVMPGTTKTAVEIGYRLDIPVRCDLYDYLTTDLA